ncbi:MAG: AAA family ATPase [Gemmatimonadetes bacterium]|nr:AAA family ATPase [Gemmatimonadota bacterium]
MDFNRLAMDLSAALEDARSLAQRAAAAYIKPKHLFLALLGDGGALRRIGSAASLDVDMAVRFVQNLADPGNEGSLEAGRQPIAARALRDLLDRAFVIAERRGTHTVGVLEVALAAVESPGLQVGSALTDAGWNSERLTRALDDSAVMQPVEAKGATPERPGSALDRFSRDLTQMAREGKLTPVVGRDEELRHVIQVLLRKTKNNPVLVGDPGTGKTAIVEALAQRIAAQDVPESLRNARVMALDLTGLVAGAKYRGEFEERIKAVVDEVRARKDIVLFLDELHTLVGAGGGAGGMDAANILKPALARGELRAVGATTHEEYREHIEKDGALARRFEKVVVEEPDDDLTLAMLRGLRSSYEMHHRVRVTDDGLQSIVKLARRHIRDRAFPDKAFDILDEASASIRLQLESKPNAIDERERTLAREQRRLEAMRMAGDADADVVAEQTAALANEVKALTERWMRERDALRRLEQTREAIALSETALTQAEAAADVGKAAEIRYGSLKFLREQEVDEERALAMLVDAGALVPREVTPATVADVVARRARVPVARMMESEKDRLLRLEERLAQRVIGQPSAVTALADAARRMRADLRKKRKPASFLFVGPTGVGKTELAKALAASLFDDDSALIRIDMAEYKDSGSVSGLIGSRPGLVGSDEGGFLTEQVRRSPHSIVLFDEIEKAHPEVIDILLGVLDEGRLTDAKGRHCDFTNTVIILTSNLGVREASEAGADHELRKEIILKVVQSSLRPELYNRISSVLPFNALLPESLQTIVRLHLQALHQQLREQYRAALAYDDEVVAYLAATAYDPAYGARPVERTIDRLILSDLSRLIISGQLPQDGVVRLGMEATELFMLAGTPEEVDEEMSSIARNRVSEAVDAPRSTAASPPPAAGAVSQQGDVRLASNEHGKEES